MALSVSIRNDVTGWRELRQVISASVATATPETLCSVEPSGEDLAWLSADIGGELPLHDWAAEDLPAGHPVRFVPGQGLMTDGKGRRA